MIISTTELRLKSIAKFLPAIRLSGKIINEAQRAPGVLHVRAHPTSLRTLVTLTAWESEEAMMQFVRSGTHLEAMKQTAVLASDTRSAHWEANKIPSLKEARLRLDQPVVDVRKR